MTEIFRHRTPIQIRFNVIWGLDMSFVRQMLQKW